MKVSISLVSTILAGALFALSPVTADAKDKGKGKGPKLKGKSHPHQVINSRDWDRGASAFAPGRSGNLPPGHGGVPPGQAKKIMRGDSQELLIQRALLNNGYYHGPIDGYIGRGSRSAIMRYQADHGLPATGIIDHLLLRALGLY
ncbi:MAG TPA: peptidoglycan-binding domain-containing protein [Prosthecobacter sp.]|nr:peptidoglycan-binding domain-containing protein [Prosthecobacter sp.]